MRSRDAGGRASMTGGALESMREAEQRRLAPRAPQEHEADRRAVGDVPGRDAHARIAGLGPDGGTRPSRKHERVQALPRQQWIDTLDP